MARANFNLETDVIAELYLPANRGTFVLGISKLDGTDVLAGDGDGRTWQQVQASVTSIDVVNGGSLSEGIIYQPEPGEIEITLQNDDLDPLQNQNVHAGVQIRVKVLDDTLGLGYWYLFQGFIDDVTATYTVNGATTVRITASDVLKDVLNYRHATFDGTICPTNERIQKALDPFGLTLDDFSYLDFQAVGTVDTADVLNGDIINDALLVELGWLSYNPKDDQIEFLGRGKATGVGDVPSTTRIFSNVHSEDASHYCFNDISVISSDAQVSNSLNVSLVNNPAISAIITNTDSVDLYGVRATDIAVNLTVADEIQSWGRTAANRSPIKRVDMIGTNPVVNGTLKNIAQIDIGDVCTVNYERPNGAITGNYGVSKYRHTITVETWQTTLELWRN